MDLGRTMLLDKGGRPLSVRVQSVLRDLAPRLARQCPILTDDVVLTEVLEEAGQKIDRREASGGPIEKLHGYAWVVLRRVVTSRMRRGAMRIALATTQSDTCEIVLAGLQSRDGRPEQIESRILLSEMLRSLTSDEREICSLKQLGFSSREIATARGMSVEAIDTFFFRLKHRIRAALDPKSGSDGHVQRGRRRLRVPECDEREK